MEKFLTFSEMSEILGISKTRLYDLIRDGILPQPLRNPSNNRPYWSSELADSCRQVVKSRVGLNGQPYTPNRKGKKSTSTTPPRDRHDGLISSLSALGMAASPKQIDEALKSLPPNLEEGDLVKQIFLRLRQKP